MVICATGYRMEFPFFDDVETELHPDDEHRYPLFKRMIKPGVEHLYFMGARQSSPTIVDVRQSKLLARLLTGTYALPDVPDERIMRADGGLEQYYAILYTIQIDFARYCLDLVAEMNPARRAGSANRMSSALGPALAEERLAIADLLETLTPEQWRTDTVPCLGRPRHGAAPPGHRCAFSTGEMLVGLVKPDDRIGCRC